MDLWEPSTTFEQVGLEGLLDIPLGAKWPLDLIIEFPRVYLCGVKRLSTCQILCVAGRSM
jgi:hypothetical protein